MNCESYQKFVDRQVVNDVLDYLQIIYRMCLQYLYSFAQQIRDMRAKTKAVVLTKTDQSARINDATKGLKNVANTGRINDVTKGLTPSYSTCILYLQNKFLQFVIIYLP